MRKKKCNKKLYIEKKLGMHNLQSFKYLIKVVDKCIIDIYRLKSVDINQVTYIRYICS